jgi:hypothetical protein
VRLAQKASLHSCGRSVSPAAVIKIARAPLELPRKTPTAQIDVVSLLLSPLLIVARLRRAVSVPHPEATSPVAVLNRDDPCDIAGIDAHNGDSLPYSAAAIIELRHAIRHFAAHYFTSDAIDGISVLKPAAAASTRNVKFLIYMEISGRRCSTKTTKNHVAVYRDISLLIAIFRSMVQ